MNNNRFLIDANKLRKAIEKTGLSCADHSREMGYRESFISNCLAKGHINGVCKKYLESIGIKYESITPDVKVPHINVEPKTNDLQELKKTLDEMNVNLRLIGNLLVQINEKVMK